MWVGLEGLVLRGSAGTRGKTRGRARRRPTYCSAEVSFSTLSM